MSQHRFIGKDKAGAPVTVQIGYDRPLDYVYCVVFDSEDDTTYSNLSDAQAGTHCQDVNYYRGVLRRLGITVPESMFTETEADQRNRVGNREMEHTLDPLREAAGKALKLLQGELATVLEWSCLLGENLEPIRETLDEVAEADVTGLEECIAALEAALEVNDAG